MQLKYSNYVAFSHDHGFAVNNSVHIPQELRIRSGGTERHSASN